MAGFFRGLFNRGRAVTRAAESFFDFQNRQRLAQQAEQLHERSKEETEIRFFMISKPFRELNEKQKNDLINLMAELQISPEGFKHRFNLKNINEISHDQLV